MDGDGDGYGVGCANGPDCNDGNNLQHTLVRGAVDADADGWTFGPEREFCSNGMPPPGFAPISAADDCDEINNAVHTGCGTCTSRPFNNRVWRFCSDLRDRSPAVTQCTNAGLRLASLHSALEATFVEDTLNRLGGVFLGRVWIGLREGPVRWDDGSPVDFYDYTNGGMVGSSAGEACVNIFGTTGWDDDDCGGHSFAYLCASIPQ